MIELFLVSELHVVCEKLIYTDKKSTRTIWLVKLKIYYEIKRTMVDPKKVERFYVPVYKKYEKPIEQFANPAIRFALVKIRQ